MARITIFFGEMGAGKSYYARRLADDLSGLNKLTHFLEGDSLASPEMADRVQRFRLPTRDMVIDLVDHLIVETLRLAWTGDVVVAQALYFDEDRQQIQKHLRDAGHHVDWVWVHPDAKTNVKRLLGRPKGYRWVLYWLLNKPFFERPTHFCTEI